MRPIRLKAGFAAMVISALFLWSTPASAAPVYLNFTNMTVTLGASMPTTPPNGPFENVPLAQSLANIIDLSLPTDTEFHTQAEHVWVNNVPSLELAFDLGSEYDLKTLHFWNYFTEGFDVDNIALSFFNGANVGVGSLNFAPALGGPGTSDAIPIAAQHATLAFPSNVRYVNAVLTGSNGEVDFNNMGFTGELSPVPVPEPGTMGLLALGLVGVAHARLSRRR